MKNQEIAQVLLDALQPAIRKLQTDYTRQGSVSLMKLQIARNTALRNLGYMEGKNGKAVKFKPSKIGAAKEKTWLHQVLQDATKAKAKWPAWAKPKAPKPKREKINRVIALRFSEEDTSTDNSIGGPNDYAYKT
jgi:hypothetical protein